MEKKRIILLLGAGAAIQWGGPKTNKLTEMICQNGFKNASGKYVTQEIFDHLNHKCSIPKEKINFETVLNVIEDFIDYWSFEKGGNINGLAFFVKNESGLWHDFMHYTTIDESSKRYSLEIPGASDFVNVSLKDISISISPQKVYFQALFGQLLDAIANEIFEYSAPHSLDQEHIAINVKLTEKYLKSLEKNLLRVYTLNYDRVVQQIFNNANIQFFEGTNGEFRPEIEKLNFGFSHFNTFNFTKHRNYNCIYHLHGSAYWEVLSEDANGLPYYSFVLSSHSKFPSEQGYNTAEIEVENGRRTQISNIITGYRKTIRTGLSPFRQMIAAFDRDCIDGDKLVIVGYSFGDGHINDILYKALSVNRNIKIEIVDPEIVIRDFFLRHVSKWAWFSKLVEPTKLGENIFFYEEYNLTIYKLFFKDYLELNH
ncbi:MAG TPA: SIR2 family protein [Flavobacteriaceae bacterium]|nr:SIR2 family protein [Aequorivita sp.]HZW77680.1 SIR2 family protein [Flavobacteriaceae bacterium]